MRRCMPKGKCCNKRSLTAGKIALLSVHLDHTARVVQHADDCTLRPRMGAILCVCDCITDRVGPGIPNRAVSKQLTNQIKAVSVLARTNLVMVVVRVQHWAARLAIHSFHTCYRPRYLSNEFAYLKETILLLFVNGHRVASVLFPSSAFFLY